MSKYMTNQRKVLLDFLSHHVDECFSARQISESLGDERISVSSVYRNLSSMESDRLLKRVSKPGSREVFFQYSSAPQCRNCLHLSCSKCGKTFHMDRAGADLLVREVAEKEGFSLDVSNTVLYGICNSCKK